MNILKHVGQVALFCVVLVFLPLLVALTALFLFATFLFCIRDFPWRFALSILPWCFLSSIQVLWDFSGWADGFSSSGRELEVA